LQVLLPLKQTTVVCARYISSPQAATVAFVVALMLYCSSFVPHPVTPLHKVDAQIKQVRTAQRYPASSSAGSALIAQYLHMVFKNVGVYFRVVCLPSLLNASTTASIALCMSDNLLHASTRQC
jgi:hypothetical protein